MPLTFTAAHSSRVSKPAKKKSFFDRSAAESFARLARPQSTKGSSSPRPTSKPEDDLDNDVFGERLEDHGLVRSLPPPEPPKDVVSTIQHIKDSMFDPVPLERSGLSSTRIAEVLNFRKGLPPLVTNAHVHAIVQSPTAVEREIAALVAKAVIRRVTIPGRGNGAKAMGDGIALTADWAMAVEAAVTAAPAATTGASRNHNSAATTKSTSPSFSTALASKYNTFLKSASTDTDPLLTNLNETELTTLMRAGFVTASSAALRSSSNVFSASRHASALAGSRTSFDSVARAASGSVEAIGGADAVLSSGGGGGGTSGSGGSGASYDLHLTLPSTGAYLKLVQGARAALVSMLAKTKYREAPLYLLRERWDGNVGTRAAYGRSKDPFAQILPGKIRKWKEFYGVRFDWVLAECLGAGLVEVFETGSVGLGVRTL